MPSSTLASFLGALQASLAVLLTIGYGVVASRLSLLKASSARDISKICVRLFLPALLISNIGSEFQAGTIHKYVPILVWALIYTLTSMALGVALRKLFDFPAWTIPAICFNNTTALPLLLIQSLETAGVLSDLTMGPDDSTSDALKRAKSYFLVSAMVGNSLTFAIGPRLLDDEETPDSHHDEQQKAEDQDHNGSRGNVQDESQSRGINLHREESEQEHENPTNSEGRTAEEEEEHETETTTLLPSYVSRREQIASRKLAWESNKYWSKIPSFIRTILAFLFSFLNAPLIGALMGAFIGLVPPLHKAFFSDPDEGGFLKAWLTESIKNIGDLFATLQLVVVGAKLSGSLMKMKMGKESGRIPLIPVLTIFFIRFVLWPIISITTIYHLASKTSLLSKDPMLYFVMMLMPTGPPATKLVSLADVSGSDDKEKGSIAKFLTLSYCVCPVICFAVVGSLKACLAIGE